MTKRYTPIECDALGLFFIESRKKTNIFISHYNTCVGYVEKEKNQIVTKNDSHVTNCVQAVTICVTCKHKIDLNHHNIRLGSEAWQPKILSHTKFTYNLRLYLMIVDILYKLPWDETKTTITLYKINVKFLRQFHVMHRCYPKKCVLAVTLELIQICTTLKFTQLSLTSFNIHRQVQF